jgi:hypothetical protein
MRHTGFPALRTLFIILLILIFQPLPVFSSDSAPPRNVVGAALEGITLFVKGGQEKSLRLPGFKNSTQAQTADLGQGFRIYALSPDGLLSRKASSTLDSLTEATNLWQFLVLADGKATSLLTVDFFKDAWTPVSIGASGLAAEIAAILNKWPSSAGYTCKFIRVYQAKSDFMVILRGADIVGIALFSSARIAMGLEDSVFDPLDLHDSAEVLAKLTPAVKASVGR